MLPSKHHVPSKIAMLKPDPPRPYILTSYSASKEQLTRGSPKNKHDKGCPKLRHRDPVQDLQGLPRETFPRRKGLSDKSQEDDKMVRQRPRVPTQQSSSQSLSSTMMNKVDRERLGHQAIAMVPESQRRPSRRRRTERLVRQMER